MNLYTKQGNQFIPVNISSFPKEEIEESSFCVVTVGSNGFPASRNDLQNIQDIFSKFNIKSIALPHWVQVEFFNIDEAYEHLLLITIPNDLSKEEKYNIENEFNEFLSKFDNTISFKVVRENLNFELIEKEDPYKLPPLTQQFIMHVDGTPDENYVLRILKAYRENCNCKWSGSNNVLFEEMNKHQDQRAKLLDEAIDILSKVRE